MSGDLYKRQTDANYAHVHVTDRAIKMLLRYWDGYDLQGGSGNNNFCQYQIANEAWQEQLKLISKDAYLALGGSGYGRGICHYYLSCTFERQPNPTNSPRYVTSR